MKKTLSLLIVTIVLAVGAQGARSSPSLRGLAQ